jgi:prepilin-type N-terminal cleavage/methylation domain-containing protein
MRRITPTSPRTGFSLLEMLLVVVILAMLAGILIPVLEREMIVAADSRRASDLKTIQSAVESYYRVNQSYPDTAGVWQGDAPNFGGFGYGVAGYIPNMVPDYMQALPTDPSSAYPDSADGGYMYRSDGLDYKFVVNLSPEFYLNGNPFFDPSRPNTAWQVSSPGGYNW